MAAKRNKKEEPMAPPQKAAPVEPPEPGSARAIPSPMSFFDDPRMARAQGVKNFAPTPVRQDAAGNAESTSEEGNG